MPAQPTSFLSWLGKRTPPVPPLPKKSRSRPRLKNTMNHSSDFMRNFDMGEVDNLFPSSAGGGTSINSDLYHANAQMRKRARYEAQNTPAAKRALKEFGRNVVGKTGIRLQPAFVKANKKPDAFDNRIVLEAFEEWSKKGVCDVTGQLSLQDIQKIAVTSHLRDGELFIRMVRNWPGNRFGFALQVIEADKVGDRDVRIAANGNNILMGIEVNEWMRPVAYHVAKQSAVNSLWSSQPSLQGDTMRIPAADMIHYFIQERAEQLRGYTFMSAAFRLMHMGKGLIESEVIASRIGANKQGIIVSPEGKKFEGDDEGEDGEIIMDSEPGEWDVVPHGTEIKSWDPQHPNATLPDFMTQITQTVGIALDMQYFRLSGNLKGASFSSMKHGHANDVDVFGEMQAFTSSDLLTPIYSNFIDEAILHDALKIPMSKRKKYDAVKWVGPILASIDPLKDAVANKTNLANGTTTVTEIVGKNNRTIEDLLDEREAELQLAADRGINLDGAAQPTIVLGGNGAAMQQESFAAIIEIVEKATNQTIKKASALALLARLGLSEQEAEQLLEFIPDDEAEPIPKPAVEE